MLSLLGLAMAAGWSVEDSIKLANVGAGIEVSKVGVTPIERWELELGIRDAEAGAVSKVISLDNATRVVERARAVGQKVVFANGCFDIFHSGHALLLDRARALGDILVIGLNSDASVRRLKGESRPILEADKRARTLSGFSAVDHILIFDEETPLKIIEALRPDILVKGEDYRDREVVGRELVEAYGGRVELVPLEPDTSTSAILERLDRSGSDAPR